MEVKVKGPRFEKLIELAGVLKTALTQMDGVYDIRDDFRTGKSELRIYLKPEKAHQYGLTTFQVAQTVRTAIEGTKATTYREADEAIDVIVKYEENTLTSFAELNNLLIATPTGAIVPLKDVADIAEEKGYADIQRFDGERAISVYASVDRTKTTPVKVNQALISAFADVESLYPGYQLDFRGVFDEITESFSELWKLFTVGLLLIYVILGAQFKVVYTTDHHFACCSIRDHRCDGRSSHLRYDTEHCSDVWHRRARRDCGERFHCSYRLH